MPKKKKNYIGLMVADDRVALERYDAHILLVEGFGIVCMQYRLTICEISCVADIELMETSVCSVPESSFVGADRLTHASSVAQ